MLKRCPWCENEFNVIISKTHGITPDGKPSKHKNCFSNHIICTKCGRNLKQ